MSDSVIRLRKIQSSDLDQFEIDFQSRLGASDNQWFGFWNSTAARRALQERHLLGGDANMLAVTINGELAGRVEWLRAAWGRADTSACWEMAIGVVPQYRARGIGTEAQRLLTDYLFTHYPIRRVQATTAAENVAEQRCLEKLGYLREGVIRDAQWRDGAWHDQWIYSVLRPEWTVTHTA